MHEGVAPGVQRDVDELTFKRTRWDLIQLVAGENSAEYEKRQAARALNQLCEIYRGPILAYFTRYSATPHDAEDLTQEFLSRRIGPELFANTAAQKGRFRAWLLVSLKNFRHDRAARARAEKRGGNIQFVPFQDGLLPSGDLAAQDEIWFDACWAKALVDRALQRMQQTFAARGDGTSYDVLVSFICESGDGVELLRAAEQLGIGLNALHVRLSRFRALYAKSVRDELARTVSSPAQIEPEIRYLLDVLSTCS